MRNRGFTNDDATLPRRLFLLVIVLVLAAAYGEALVGVRTMYFRDFGFFGYPLAHYHREAFWRGEVPLWNPLSCCGLPFLAQWNTLVLYPGSLVYLLLPLPWSLNVYCFGHLALGAVGMYELGRQRCGSQLGGGVAGIGYGLGGMMMTSLMWPNNVAALGWMPWVVMGAERGRERGGKWVWAGGVVGAAQMLSGAPEIILFTWMVVGLEWLVGEVGRGWLGRWKRGGRLLAVGVVVVGMALGQLLPFLELLSGSHRSEEFARGTWPMPCHGWANFLVPLFHTSQESSGIHFLWEQYWTTSYYVGVSVFLLALLSLWHHRDRRVWSLAGIALVGFWLALGEGGRLTPLFETFFPVFRVMRYPVKFVVLTTFALPLLAAYGWAGLEKGPGDGCPPWRSALALVGLALVVMQLIMAHSLAHPVAAEDCGATFRSGWSRSMFLSGAAVLWWWLRRPGHGRTRAASALLLVWLSVDLLTHTPQHNPLGDPWLLAPGLVTEREMNPVPRHGETRALGHVEATRKLLFHMLTDLQRDYVAKRVGMLGNCNLLDAVPLAHGFFSLYLREANQVVRLAAGLPPERRARLLDLISVSQTTSLGQELSWHHRPTALPMIRAGLGASFVEGGDTLAALQDEAFDVRRTVVLLKSAEAVVGGRVAGRAVVQPLEVQAERIRLRLELETPSMLFLAMSYDPKWRALVDGRPAPILRANHGFQAVPVPRGGCEVVLFYRNATLAWSSVASGAMALLALSRMGSRKPA